MGKRFGLVGQYEFETNAVNDEGGEGHMNYPTFMKKVDEYAAQGEIEELQLFIHEIARNIRESERDSFLTLLMDICNIQDEKKKRQNKKASESLEGTVDSMISRLQKIIDGEVELDSDYNEEWDDWNDSADDEFEFSDPEHLLDDINSAFDLIHLCLDHEAYEKGAELAQKLSEVEVQVGGEYSEYTDETMSLYDLDVYDLLNTDFDRGVKEAAYLTCVGTGDERKAAAVLAILDNFQSTSVRLEDILQIGREEIDLDTFLPEWIAELAKRRTAYADKLLVEAQGMIQDEEAILNNASKYAADHPILFKAFLELNRDSSEVKKMKEVGIKALQTVPVVQPEREQIALLAAEYALADSDEQTAEKCWMEAFRTMPSVENFLRLRLLAQEWDDYSEEARAVYNERYKEITGWGVGPVGGITFFDGCFNELLNKYMKAGKGIGWSRTFMKEGIALMLLLLDHGAVTVKSPGMKEMLRKAVDGCDFTVESFCRGTNIEKMRDDAALFRKLFDQWRETVSMGEKEQQEWLERIKKWIALRVEAIMSENRRNYYDECASFVAAFGEVLESRGIPGAKAKLMEEYRSQYSRRRAFHDSLRAYGMKK